MSNDKLVLVANVGERDLYYNVSDNSTKPNFCHFELGKDDEKQAAQYLSCKSGARYISEAISGRLQKDPSEAQRLRYPILKTVLEDGVFASGKTIGKLILVVTNQPLGTREEFRCRDSLHTGQLLKQLIERDYPGKVGTIEVVSCQENPSNRERTYNYFGKLLPEVAPEPHLQEFHASLSGGAPALNDSLQEQALRLYKVKCRFYEVIPPPEDKLRQGAEKGTIQKVSAKPFLRDLAISIIEQLLNRYDYSGALEVLKMFTAVKFWDDEVEAVLKHAERRINFNFQEAAGPLQRYYQNIPLLGGWYQQVQKPILLDQLIEAYFIIQTRYQNKEYTDLLWRVAAFYENGLRLMAATVLKLPELEQEKRLRFEVLDSKQKQLHQQMLKDTKAKRICFSEHGRQFCFWESNIYNFRKLCRYGLNKLPSYKQRE